MPGGRDLRAGRPVLLGQAAVPHPRRDPPLSPTLRPLRRVRVRPLQGEGVSRGHGVRRALQAVLSHALQEERGRRARSFGLVGYGPVT